MNPNPSPQRDIVVIGASAGGVQALIALCEGLPETLPATVLVVLHTTPNGPGLLPRILRRYTRLEVRHARANEPLRQGVIYIAPPDRHILVQPGHVMLSGGPRENRMRPAIDPLFRTAAQTCGPRVIGVLLSGTLSDGVAGLVEIQAQGGITMVQDPEEALFPFMPRSAQATLDVDYTLPARQIAAALTTLSQSNGDPKETRMPEPQQEDDLPGKPAALQADKANFQDDTPTPTPRSLVTCPECGGVLWETQQGQQTHFVCQIGHRFSEESMVDGQNNHLEYALWAAVRALDERASLYRRLAHRAAGTTQELTAARFLQAAEEAEKHAATIRHIASDSKFTNPQKHEIGEEA